MIQSATLPTRPDASTEDTLRRMVETALPVALEHARITEDMRDALASGDEGRALTLARQLCGLET